MEVDKRFSEIMAGKKAGHNLPNADSAKTPPTREATPVSSNGPEDYSGYGAAAQPEGDRIEAASTRSSSQSSKVKAKIHENHDTGTDIPRSATSSVPDPSAVISNYHAIKPSLYGSPFAYASCQNKHEFFKGLLPESTCLLFDQIVAEAPSLSKRLHKDPGLTYTGSYGHFCALKKRKINNTKLQIYSYGPDIVELSLPMSADSTAASKHPTNVGRSNPARSIGSGSCFTGDVLRVRKNRENEYFIMENEFDHLHINSTKMDPNTVAGPLPDFAVLELRDMSYLWWRTATALEYMPVS